MSAFTTASLPILIRLASFRPESLKSGSSGEINLIETGNFLTELRRYHGDKPVFVTARQFPNDECRAEFSRLLIGLRKPEEDYLAFRNH
jgi:hypothetical protein